MNERYSSKLTAHSVERSKQSKLILYYFVNAKLKSHIQAYTVSAGGPAAVRSRRAKSPYIQSHSNVTYDI